jgi:hypothetical protein
MRTSNVILFKVLLTVCNCLSNYCDRIFLSLEIFQTFISGLELSNSVSASPPSSNESGDNAVNIGPEELGPVAMDENVCPESCEQELYKITFELRGEW